MAVGRRTQDDTWRKRVSGLNSLLRDVHRKRPHEVCARSDSEWVLQEQLIPRKNFLLSSDHSVKKFPHPCVEPEESTPFYDSDTILSQMNPLSSKATLWMQHYRPTYAHVSQVVCSLQDFRLKCLYFVLPRGLHVQGPSPLIWSVTWRGRPFAWRENGCRKTKLWRNLGA
jgi:hypothetical protein